MRVLRFLLALDSAVLLLLGLLLILAPHLAATAFQFGDLPPGVHYLVGLWGCALLTMGGGYLLGATDPVRYVLWIQVGIARGALECLLGLLYVAQGIVTFQQAGFGIVLAGLLALAYGIFYPRESARRSAPVTGPAA